MGDNTGYIKKYLKQYVGGFKLLKSVEENYNPGIKMKILVDKKDPIEIPFDKVPPTEEQSECNRDLSIKQMLDKQVKNNFPESFGHGHAYRGNSRFFHTLLWKNIKINYSKLLEEWGLYLSSHANEVGFHYDTYTTYGDLYNVDHADPRSDNIQKLFQTFLLQKNIEIIYCDKYANLKDIAKEIYNTQHIQ